MRDSAKSSWTRRSAKVGGCAAVLAVVTGMPGACSTPAERPEPEVDCRVEVDYDFSPVTLTIDGRIYWFGFGDKTPGAYNGAVDGVKQTTTTLTCPPGEVVVNELSTPPDPYALAEISVLAGKAPKICNVDATLRLKGNGHKDWGMAWSTVLSSRTGYYPATRESNLAYQGIAFWARSEPGHDKTITMLIATAQTAKPTDGQASYHPDPAAPMCSGKILRDRYDDPVYLVDSSGKPITDDDGHALRDHPDDCKSPAVDEGAATYRVDTNGNVVLSSGVARPDECDNPFQRQVTFSNQWQLHLLPFDSFYQLAEPNRDPKGIDPSKIYQIIFRSEKEKDVDIWIDSLKFYREVGWEPPGGLPGGEGGASSTTTTDGAGGATP